MAQPLKNSRLWTDTHIHGRSDTDIHYQGALFLHDSRDCPETAVSLLHQKRLGSGSEPTNTQKIKLLK